MLALQFAMHGSPVRLLDAPMAALTPTAGVKRRLERPVVHGFRQRPEEARGLSPFQRFPNRRTRHAKPAGDLMRRYGRRLQPNNLARMAHRNPLRWH